LTANAGARIIWPNDMPSALFLVAALLASAIAAPVIDNPFVRVTRNAAPCADASAGCGQRILVALAPAQVTSDGRVRTLTRGDVVVFDRTRSYDITGERFLEVVVKPDHPRGARPSAYSPPEKNTVLYDDDELFIFEEKLDPGDTRARHGHGQRLVVVVNDTRLQQWPDGAEMLFKNQVPDDVHFNEPVVHVVKTVGAAPLRNIVIEFKP
jgi:hypothetical protein